MAGAHISPPPALHHRVRARISGARTIALARREDWPTLIGTPLVITTLIGLGALALGLVFVLQSPNRTYDSATFRVMIHWGQDLRFVDRPMAPWGIALALSGAVVVGARVWRRPVISGLGMIASAVVLCAYDAGAWASTGKPRLATHGTPVPGHTAASLVSGPSLGAPVLFAVVAIWWILTAGALVSVRPGEHWPYQPPDRPAEEDLPAPAGT